MLKNPAAIIYFKNIIIYEHNKLQNRAQYAVRCAHAHQRGVADEAKEGEEKGGNVFFDL